MMDKKPNDPGGQTIQAASDPEDDDDNTENYKLIGYVK